MIKSQLASYSVFAPRSAFLRPWSPDPVADPWYTQAFVTQPVVCGERYMRAKRLVDLLVVALLLVPTLAVLAICAAAVWIESPGQVVFTQNRTGRFGRRFKMYKLRTMVANAEELKAQYAHLNVLTAPDFKIPNDPRMTRVGRFLRRTSLDELPQIFNVLSGDMTLVGPRPTSFAPETYSPWQWERLACQPGLTGLWQVAGRAELDFDDRCRLDLFYVRHCSLRLDLAIALRTIGAILAGRGAS